MITMWLLQQLAEERICEARDRGEFDNLPGAGQALVLDDDRDVPQELRMAYRLLRNAGFVPPEVALRREIAALGESLAQARTVGERHQFAGRLNALLVRLELARGRPSPPSHEEHYYRRLRERSGDGPND